MPTPNAQSREKRSFFRVRDDISLDYRVVDTHTASSEDPTTLFPESAALNLFAEFRRIDGESDQILHSISEQNRLVADYLVGVNRKINLLAQEILADRQANSPGSSTKVNLSEGGIGFGSDKAIYKSSYIALRLMFLPAYVGVVLFAQVIRCEAKKDGYQIAAKFHRLSDQQRQVLSKQIMQAQLAAKRRARDEL